MPIYIATSYGFCIIATGLYLLIASSLWLSSTPWWLSIILTLILLCDLRVIIKLYGLRNHKYSVAMVLPDVEKWRYQLLNGREYKGKLNRYKCFRSRWCLILYLQGLRVGRYILIPRDAISEHHYRYLALRIFGGS